MYQKLDKLDSKEQLKAYRSEIEDQYGKLPKEVRSLFEKKELDIALKETIVQSYREVKNQMEITFSSLYSQHVDGVKLFESFTKISKDITIRYANQCIIVLLPKGKNDLKMAVECIEKAKELLTVGGKSVQEVTYLTGYENPNTFIRIFKRYSGITPGRYREMYSEQ